MKSSRTIKTPFLRPRGHSMKLPHGGLPEIFSPHLAQLIEHTGGINGPIGLQFVAQPGKERRYFRKGTKDPLDEDEHEVAPGLVYKYRAQTDSQGNVVKTGRALWTVTRTCASYCRFCTRGRQVGATGTVGKESTALSRGNVLDRSQIDQTLRFIKNEEGLNEIILSGGDPMTLPVADLTYIIQALSAFQKTGKLRIVRIGTRLPVHNPDMIREKHIRVLAQLSNPRIMIHVNHPAELTSKTRDILAQIRKQTSAVIMTQTVLLRGVNDSVAVLYELFNELAALGIVPYYVYQNDAVYWARHFTVPIHKAIRLWQELRPILSGVAATARFVIDVPMGYGKIPIPEGNAWKVDYDLGFWDFYGKNISLEFEKTIYPVSETEDGI